jgi:hypothetical protein
MVARLLEPQERGEDEAFALDAGSLGELPAYVVEDGLVEAGLFLCEGAEDLHLLFLGQVLDDGPVGLEAPQDEGPRDALEAPGGHRVRCRLDGQEKVASEGGLGSEENARGQGGLAQASRQPFHHRPPAHRQRGNAPRG